MNDGMSGPEAGEGRPSRRTFLNTLRMAAITLTATACSRPGGISQNNQKESHMEILRAGRLERWPLRPSDSCCAKTFLLTSQNLPPVSLSLPTSL